jgi:hypothetical protein
MRQRWVALVVSVAVAMMATVSAVTPLMQADEDRPPIIISSGSVILTVARGAWARAVNGQFLHEQATGRPVRSFAATTGTGEAACTVSGESLVVRYGANSITIGRQQAQGGRQAALVRLPAEAAVTVRDAQSLVIETDDALVSVSSGDTSCAVAGGRISIRQVH